MANCPNCHAEVSSGFKFCKQCGHSLAPPPQTEPPRAEAAREPRLATPAAASPTRPPEPQPVTPGATRPSWQPEPQMAASSPPRPSPPPEPMAFAAGPARAPRVRRAWRLPVILAVVLVIVVAGGLYLGAGYLPVGVGTKGALKVDQHLNQGLTFASMKDYDNAIMEFTKAIEADPKSAAAYANRAVAYMQQKKPNKALDDLKQAESLNPKDKMVHYNLAALYAAQNQRDRALDSLDKALALGFTDYDALRGDPDLASLRRDPEFQKVLEKHKVFLK